MAKVIREKSLDLWQPDLLRIGGVEKWIDGLIDNILEIKDDFTFPRTGDGLGFSFIKEKLNKLEI